MTLEGRKIIVTSGPTQEALDPVRYFTNRSSGKQGHAIAAALAAKGAKVVLVSGPVNIPAPAGVVMKNVMTADEMLEAVKESLPADVGIFAAAVADWKPESVSAEKIKKDGSGKATVTLVENPDILKYVAVHSTQRPSLVIGFAAETEKVVEHAELKRARKHCDWIVANDVSGGKAFDADENEVVLLTGGAPEKWEKCSKSLVASKLAERIEQWLLQNDAGAKAPRREGAM